LSVLLSHMSAQEAGGSQDNVPILITDGEGYTWRLDIDLGPESCRLSGLWPSFIISANVGPGAACHDSACHDPAMSGMP
jgi:hypothetical protein